MGFREKRTVYRLVFEGDYEGLVVKATFPPMGVVMDIQQGIGEVAGLVGKQSKDLTAEEITSALGSESAVVDAFLDNLVEWNIEDADGQPIPPSREGFRRVSGPLGKHVIKTWFDYVTGDVPDPLGQPSSGGRPSLEGSLPMEPLSPNPPSLHMPSLSSAAVSGSGASQVS